MSRYNEPIEVTPQRQNYQKSVTLGSMVRRALFWVILGFILGLILGTSSVKTDPGSVEKVKSEVVSITDNVVSYIGELLGPDEK